MSTKIGRYWYKDFGTTLLNKEFQKYADEIYEDLSEIQEISWYPVRDSNS